MSPHQTYQLYDLNGFQDKKKKKEKQKPDQNQDVSLNFKFNETGTSGWASKRTNVRYEETPKHQIPSTSNHQIHQLYDLLDGFQDEKRRRKSRPKWRHKQIGFQSIQDEQN
jgi:hypothetical protein